MEATCPHCQARLNVPAPGAYACGNCGKRVDVAPEPAAGPASVSPPAGAAPAGSFDASPPPAGAYGLEPPSISPPPTGTPAAPQPSFGAVPPPVQPPSWSSPPPPNVSGAAGLPPTAPLPGVSAPPPFDGGTIPGVPGTPPPVVYGAPQPGYAVPPVLNPAEQAPCANHPGNAASGVCERCGDFMCRLCTTTVEGRNYCPKCFDLLYNRGSLQFAQRLFVLPGVSFGLGIGALIASCVCFLSIPLGIGGIWTAVRALKEYGERPDLPNRWMANTGLVLSILGILEGIGTIIWFIVLSTRGGN